MPTENPFPLNISNKVNSPALLAWLIQFGDTAYLSADEINKINNALEYLYSISSGGTNLFLGTYTSLENLIAAHPSPDEGSRATIANSDADDDLAVWDNGDSVWRIFEGAGAIIQDNQAKIIEFDLLTTFGTSDFAALTTGAVSDKLNTLSADISPIQFPFVKISKDVTGLYQIYVPEGIGAGNTSAVMPDNVKLLVDSSVAAGGSARYVMFSHAFGNYPLNGNFYSFSKTFAPYDQNSLNSYGSTLNISTLFANGLPMLVPKGTKLVEAYLGFNGGSDSSYNLQIHTNEISNGANASIVTPNNNQTLVNHTFTTSNTGFSKFLIPLTILTHANLTEHTELFWVIKGTIVSAGNNTYNPKIILIFE